MISVFCLNNTQRLIANKPIPKRYVDRNRRRELKATSASSRYPFLSFNVALPLQLMVHVTHHEIYHENWSVISFKHKLIIAWMWQPCPMAYQTSKHIFSFPYLSPRGPVINRWPTSIVLRTHF